MLDFRFSEKRNQNNNKKSLSQASSKLFCCTTLYIFSFNLIRLDRAATKRNLHVFRQSSPLILFLLLNLLLDYDKNCILSLLYLVTIGIDLLLATIIYTYIYIHIHIYIYIYICRSNF